MSIALDLEQDLIDDSVHLLDRREKGRQRRDHGGAHDEQCLGDDGESALPEIGQVARVMDGDVLELADAGLEGFLAVVAHGGVEDGMLVLEHGEDVRPEDDGAAGEVAEPEDRLHGIRERDAAVWELEREREAFVPLGELKIEFGD